MVGHSFTLSSTTDVFTTSNNGALIPTKKKRKPAGTPDPDAEVIYLSPELLMESDRFVCEICNQSFQREQNLQMHRRRHKVPWKLLKRETDQQFRKRVYVCPEPTCLHHDPGHALGDLVGIKKHFKRKHSNKKQWVCEKCSKGYAVHSDFKAHIKICGTRGHSCDCGRVFSRVEAFIEHQDTCNKSSSSTHMENFIQLSAGNNSNNMLMMQQSSSLNPYFPENPLWIRNYNTEVGAGGISGRGRPIRLDDSSNDIGTKKDDDDDDDSNGFQHNLELQLFTTSSSYFNDMHLSANSTKKISPFVQEEPKESERKDLGLYVEANVDATHEMSSEAYRLRYEAHKLSMLAMEQKALAEEKKREAKCLIGLAMQEMAKAQEIKEEALAAYNAAAQLLKTRRININNNYYNNTNNINNNNNNNNNVLQIIKCNACNREFPILLSQETNNYGGELAFSSAADAVLDHSEKGIKSLMLWARGI